MRKRNVCLGFLLAVLLGGCGSSPNSTQNPPPPPPQISITTSSLPAGQVGVAYTAMLAATGGTPPYTWSLTSGTLPANLLLITSTGAISGMPAAPVTNNPLTFKATDSSNPALTKSVNLTLTITAAAGVNVSLSPKRGGLTLSQSLPLTATVTNDVGSAGVSWSVSAGGALAGKTTTAASFSAGVAGVYTITATSLADGSKSATATIGVTDLAAVSTYHNNLSRDGTNTSEYALTPVNVNPNSFGKLFSCAVDAPLYAQPLWVANLSIAGGIHNVIFAASSHDTVYASDADASPCVTYWQQSLLLNGETYLSSTDVNSEDIYPDIGIVGTPVIDPVAKVLYVVSKSKDGNGFYQRLHALSLFNGSEQFGGPANLTSSITVPGTGDGATPSGFVPFDPLHLNQRPGLALVNGVVYAAWASHGDHDPYHGWVIGFTANNLGAGPASVWNSTPNTVTGFPQSRGGIWMSGGAPAADSSNNLYFLTGNGSFDADSGGSNYGDSTVKLSTAGGLSVAGYFTPSDQASLNANDTDHGAGGAAILVDQPSGPVAHLLIGGGKEGTLFLVDRDHMGQYDVATNHVVQALNVGQGIFATSAFWNNTLYIAGIGGPLQQYAFNAATGLFGATPVHSSPTSFAFPGATPSLSSTPTSTNGIVWALDNSAFGQGCCANGPTILHAYDATNLNTELWNSSQVAGNRDQAGNAVKFTVPTVANGKVYVGTRTEVTVYGLLPN
ncbi:MAG TPA: putative Ig domain-containing protein [Verrucomicrobiae bacterium]|nr:putative Ig domain-containing protein [Verrucomicrobiae bacterium]